MKKKFFYIFALFFALTLMFGGSMIASDIILGDKAGISYTALALTSSQTRTVQTKLKNWGYYKGAIDGIYGPKTKAAVKSFQSKNGLVSDGIVKPKTAAALGMSLSGSTSSSNSTMSLIIFHSH